jgi:UDP-N-acetylglucosamine--N-acetylmuramyl-(pentapeptide) pyrophosphoryl-undecaprenol N-acetylglucosamine transferase
MRVIISGGGTGGHIYPGIAIADEIKKNEPDAQILFVGAEGKMETEKVPKAGYDILTLPVRGLQRRFDIQNFALPFRLVSSLLKARKIITDFAPDIVVGTGGYASAAVLQAAIWAGVPVIIQEQNGYAGLTNKILARNAQKICVAYPDMEKFFPSKKIIFTGNPVRADLLHLSGKKTEALKFFGFSPEKPVLLILGGSLGAASINKTIGENIEELLRKDIQVIWQTGKIYFENIKKLLAEKNLLTNQSLWLNDFIFDMQLAYSAADLCVARAGALTISELSLCEMPTIFVPSPNVAENHQYKNAMQLVGKNAADCVPDAEIASKLMPKILNLAASYRDRSIFSINIKTFAKPNAAAQIYNIIKENIKKSAQ